MEMLAEFESEEEARDWVHEALAEKRKIMGFGHRVYKKGDSRVPIMREKARELAAASGNEELMAIAEAIEEIMIEEKGIHPNLDYPAGPLYHMLGLDIPLYTPIFAMTRVVGWTAHVMEQLADNRIIRPLSNYTGPDVREVVPLANR
jgi:citrate synthase